MTSVGSDIPAGRIHPSGSFRDDLYGIPKSLNPKYFY
jgi:hypothetical protein